MTARHDGAGARGGAAGVLEPFGHGKPWMVLDGCADLCIADMPDAYVDAIVTDPPYASLGQSGSALVKRAHNAGPAAVADSQFYEAWLRDQVEQWTRVLKPTGAVWMTCDWRGAMALERVCARYGYKQPTVGVWDRERVGMGYMLRKSYECFALATRPDFARATASEVDLWRLPWGPGDRKTGHPAEKPVELMRRAVRLVCPPGGVVLDPFCGSGSTLVAALAEGCRAIGFEREDEYAALARSRLNGLGIARREAAQPELALADATTRSAP